MSQTKQILDYLLHGNKITPKDARRLFRCDRLGARIWDINQMIYPVEVKSELIEVEDGKHVAQYYFDEYPLFTKSEECRSNNG